MSNRNSIARFSSACPSLACLALVGSAILLVGCGGPKRVEAPKFDAVAAAAEAMNLYDEDSDGELSKSELKKCASLAGALDEIDTDSSGTISEEEVKSRIEYIMEGRDGRISIACFVVKGSTPFTGATVTFEPEPFMGDVIESASGETNQGGMAVIGIDDELGNVQPGFYKVRISRMSQSGKEQIKKKYNEETIYGQEVTSGSIQLSQGIRYSI